MMRPVERSEIVDYQTYEDTRAQTRPLAIAAKKVRRIVVGDNFTFLFENRDTVRYQVLEMMRTEKIVREAEILHELKTYNELLHDGGKLGCSLLIGIDSEAERHVLLREWMGLCDHIYAELPDGTRVRPTYDARQVGDERLSSVQYLAFPLGPQAPVAIGIDHPKIEVRAALSDEQRDALQTDLDGD